jgi:tetratricopeptide (TPR) repeat protein
MKKLLIASPLMWALLFYSCRPAVPPSQKNSADTLAIGDTMNPQVKAFTRKINVEPQNPENYFLRGNILLQLDDIKAAYADISKAISLDSTNLNYYFVIADIYLKGGSADGAIDALNTIIRLDPKNTEAYLKLSKVYYYKKDYENSMKTLAGLQQLDKENVELYFIRGLNLKETGDTARALASFQKAVQLKPDFYDAYMQLGLLTSKHAGPLAPQYFDNAIRIDSMSTEAYYDKGKFYQDHKNYEKAKEAYRQLIGKNPQYDKAYFNLGFIYSEQDSVEKAYKMFDYAIRVSPAYAEAYYYRGLCGLQQGNKEQAAADFRQATSLKPNYEAAQKELNNLTGTSN